MQREPHWACMQAVHPQATHIHLQERGRQRRAYDLGHRDPGHHLQRPRGKLETRLVGSCKRSTAEQSSRSRFKG